MQSNVEFTVSIDYSGYGDKVYVVKYKEFPNIIGTGDTIEEAIKEAQGNFEVYLDYCKKEQKLKEALLKIATQDLALCTTTDGVIIASYEVYVEDLKNQFPKAKPISEEEYNLVKEALEEYGKNQFGR